MKLAGSKNDLAVVSPILERLAEAANSPDDFIEKATPELSKHNITVADIYDIGPKAPELSIVDRVRMIMNLGPRATAQTCYAHLLATFQIAEPDDLIALISNPADLSLVANYLNSILYDLDENRAAATDQLRQVLGPEVSAVLLVTDDQ